jgi:hypothetical protein
MENASLKMFAVPTATALTARILESTGPAGNRQDSLRTQGGPARGDGVISTCILAEDKIARRVGIRYFFLLDFRELLRGTFAPFFRASLSPIAMACFRLVTFRPDPLFRVPFFLRCIADLTVFEADFPYFAIFTSATPVAKYVLAR